MNMKKAHPKMNVKLFNKYSDEFTSIKPRGFIGRT